jgi:hypothetical protein
MSNNADILEDSLTVAYEAKHILTIQSIILLGIYAKDLKTCPYKNMHMDVYSTLFTITKLGSNKNVLR